MSGQPIAAVAQILGLDEGQVDVLVATEVLPKPGKGGFDVLACVRAYAAHMRSLVEQQKIDWTEARRLYEFEGVNQAEIARRVGVSKQRVGVRMRSEGWIDKSDAVRQATAAAIRKFVERDTEAVLANVAEKHELSRDLMALIRKHVDEMASGQAPNIRACLALRHLSFALRTIEALDSGLAGLREGDWRPRGSERAKVPLPDDFDFLKALRKPKRSEEQVQ